MLCGASAEFYAALQGEFPGVEITVSGGIGSTARACAASSSAKPSTKNVSHSKN